MPAARTKIEISPATARRLAGLDDLSRVFFPDSTLHRRVFIGIWTGIKYAERQFLPSGTPLPETRGVSPKVIETVRAKMKRLGLIKRVSHFNPAHGGRSGWTFSSRFFSAIRSLERSGFDAMRPTDNRIDKKKDRDAVFYV
jgi:hypothetical protein